MVVCNDDLECCKLHCMYKNSSHEFPSPWFAYHLFQVKAFASLCDNNNSKYSIVSTDTQTKVITIGII
jgi:hypothetical protein